MTKKRFARDAAILRGRGLLSIRRAILHAGFESGNDRRLRGDSTRHQDAGNDRSRFSLSPAQQAAGHSGDPDDRFSECSDRRVGNQSGCRRLRDRAVHARRDYSGGASFCSSGSDCHERDEADRPENLFVTQPVPGTQVKFWHDAGLRLRSPIPNTDAAPCWPACSRATSRVCDFPRSARSLSGTTDGQHFHP